MQLNLCEPPLSGQLTIRLTGCSLCLLQMRAVAPNAKASDIKACYIMRDALLLLDFEDPSINDLKGLLLRATMTPGILQRPEGRKFVAHLFCLDAGLVTELAAIVRNQVRAQCCTT